MAVSRRWIRQPILKNSFKPVRWTMYFTGSQEERNGPLIDQIDMKQFFVFIRKEFYHVFRDRKTLLMLFGLPVAQIMLFGFALTNEVKNSKVVIVDLARDPASQQIITKIEASQYFEIE